MKRASPGKKKVPRVDTPGLNEKIILIGSKVKIKSPRSRNSPREKDLLNVRIKRPSWAFLLYQKSELTITARKSMKGL